MRPAGAAQVATALLTTVLLAGCSLGGGASEAERAAEALRTPPDVLSAVNEADAGGSTTPETASNGADGGAVDGVMPEPAANPAAGRDPAGFLRRVDERMVLDSGLPADAGWAVLGRALERSGFALAESDREAGTHLIRYNPGAVVGLGDDTLDEADADDNDGLLGALAFWRSDPVPTVQTWQLRVVSRGKGSRITLERPDGEPAPRQAARQILAVVAEQLKP